MSDDRIVFRVHAIKRMFQRGITEEDISRVLITGTTIEDYPDDKPYPSRLVLGWCNQRPVHIVIAENNKTKVKIIITVYEPESDKWEPGFIRRRK